jgi:predicted DNA-binding antitoxin AbrB/MazE fold protein
MPITTRAVFENGVLRPLETLDLPEQADLLLTIWPLNGDDAEQETLADVLGFDPHDQEKLEALAKSQHQALEKLIQSLEDLPGSEPPHDGAANHDGTCSSSTVTRNSALPTAPVS